jgi:hypothetical protein
VLPKSKVLAVAALLAGSSAYATTVYGDFANIGANKWTGSFVVVNDGSLAELSNFTVYFDQAYANNLVLLQSPATWDTIVIEPDLPLSSNGFLDGLAIALADVLKPGERIGEFSVGFDWNSANGAPKSFAYAIYNNGPTLLESGSTTPSAAVPEPSQWLLAAAGLGVVGSLKRRRTASKGC